MPYMRLKPFGDASTKRWQGEVLHDIVRCEGARRRDEVPEQGDRRGRGRARKQSEDDEGADDGAARGQAAAPAERLGEHRHPPPPGLPAAELYARPRVCREDASLEILEAARRPAPCRSAGRCASTRTSSSRRWRGASRRVIHRVDVPQARQPAGERRPLAALVRRPLCAHDGRGRWLVCRAPTTWRRGWSRPSCCSGSHAYGARVDTCRPPAASWARSSTRSPSSRACEIDQRT